MSKMLSAEVIASLEPMRRFARIFVMIFLEGVRLTQMQFHAGMNISGTDGPRHRHRFIKIHVCVRSAQRALSRLSNIVRSIPLALISGPVGIRDKRDTTAIGRSARTVEDRQAWSRIWPTPRRQKLSAIS